MLPSAIRSSLKPELTACGSRMAPEAAEAAMVRRRAVIWNLFGTFSSWFKR